MKFLSAIPHWAQFLLSDEIEVFETTVKYFLAIELINSTEVLLIWRYVLVDLE